MSISLLMNKMYKSAEEVNLEIEIDTRPIGAAELYVDITDIVLIGSQVRFQKTQVDKLVNERIPVKLLI